MRTAHLIFLKKKFVEKNVLSLPFCVDCICSDPGCAGTILSA